MITALPPITGGTSPEPSDVWETFFQLGEMLAAMDRQRERRSPQRSCRCTGDTMYTVDASLWVNGFSQMEAGHATGRQVLEVLRTRAPPIIVPNLVLAEVAGAISRTWNDPLRAEPFATTLGRLANVTVVALDMALDDQARPLAVARACGGPMRCMRRSPSRRGVP